MENNNKYYFNGQGKYQLQYDSSDTILKKYFQELLSELYSNKNKSVLIKTPILQPNGEYQDETDINDRFKPHIEYIKEVSSEVPESIEHMNLLLWTTIMGDIKKIGLLYNELINIFIENQKI